MIQERQQRAASVSNLLIRDWTGIKRQFSCSSQDLYRERLLVAGREGLKGVEEFDRLFAHIFKLTIFPEWEQWLPACGKINAVVS